MPGRGSHHPWHEIRARYVEGHIINPDRDAFSRSWPTYDETATIFGIPMATVRNRGQREGWLRQREEFQRDVELARRRNLVEQRGARSASVDDRGLQAAEAGLVLVGMKLAWLIRRENRLNQGDQGMGVDGRELSALGLAAKRFIDVKAQVMGQPASAEDGGVDDDEMAARREERRLADEWASFAAARVAEMAEDAAPPLVSP